MRGITPLLVVVASMGIACGGDADDAGSGATTGGTDTSSGTSATSSTTAMTATLTTSSTSAESSSGDMSSESSGAPADSSSSGGDSSGTGGEACLPEPDDDACAMCTKGMCCDELVVCFEDPQCECFANCYDEMGFMSDEMCRTECMLDANPDAWGDVYNCSAMNCLGDCI